MASESQSSFGLPPATLLTLLVGVAGLFAYNKLAFRDTRPPEAPAANYQHVSGQDQDVEARLWQDPLGAVAAARASALRGNSDSGHTSDVVKSAITRKGADARVVIIGIPVGGEAYTEDSERRRRTRYAVLAGMHRAGFTAENTDHIGYFALPSKADSIVAFEWLKPDEASNSAKLRAFVLLLWIDQDGLAARPLTNFSTLLNRLDPALDCDSVDTVICKPDAAARSSPKVSRVLLGPWDSDGLSAMLRDLMRSEDGKCRPALLQVPDLRIYSYSATTADAMVLGADDDCQPSPGGVDLSLHGALAERFKTLSAGTVRLFRTVADDSVVTKSLTRELINRGVDFPGDVVLVAERDSLFARRMSLYFQDCYKTAAVGLVMPSFDAAGNHPACFTYLRGLDGRTARQGNNVADSPVESTGGGRNGSARPSAASESAVSSDTADGQSQLDYLRRLATQITAESRRRPCLSNDGASGGCQQRNVRAIGIIGTDLYDKVLVLQALRPKFPHAIFFTTDLDARLLDAQHLKWTRHLLIGSGFGLQSRPELQSDIPPFRDTYQTSAYLASLLAVDQAISTSEPSTTRSMSSQADQIDTVAVSWASSPRLFEIGRTEEFDLTPRVPLGPCLTLIQCHEVFPPPRSAFWADPSSWIGMQVAFWICLAMLGAAWFMRSGVVPWVPNIARRFGIVRARTGRACIFLLAILFFGLVATCWPSFARFAVGHWNTQSPVPIFSGASIWPACMTEILAIIAVVAFVCRGQRVLNRNALNLSRQFNFSRTPRRLIRLRTALVRREIGPARLKELTWFPIQTVSTVATELKWTRLSGVEKLLARYLYRGQCTHRLLRVTIASILPAVLLIGIDSVVGTGYIEVGVLAPDGGPLGDASATLSIMSLWSLEFLVLWVADAMLLSRAFTVELAALNPDWPAAGLTSAMITLSMPRIAVTTLLNMKLVATRTECVMGLVWYPSILIVGMAIAALTLEFGPYSFGSNPVSLILSAIPVVTAAVLLRRAAESLRHKTSGWLENYRSRALGATVAGQASLAQAAQIDNLIVRIADFTGGAFAPYSRQPLVSALLIPAITYAAGFAIQYLHLPQLE